jgi:hypothetical protein
MNIKVVIFAIIVLFVTSGYAGAAEKDKQKTAQETKTVQGTETAQATETAQGTDDEAEDPDEWICKRVQKTGTRFKTKMCGTRAQWEESERNAKDTTELMRNRPQQGKASG